MSKSNLPGNKGGPEHVAIVNLIKENILSLLHQRGYPYAGIIFNQKLQSTRLNYSGREQIPDGMICERYIPYEEMTGSSTGEIILIEVGDYKPDKWNQYPVIHIGLNRKVTPVMNVDSDFRSQTLKAVSEVITNDFSYEYTELSLKEYRDLATFAISGVGLTSKQIEELTIGDIKIDEDGKGGYVRINEYGEILHIRVSKYVMDIIETYKKARISNGELLSDDSPFYGAIRGETSGRRNIQKRIQEVLSTRIYSDRFRLQTHSKLKFS
jgi:hypothetical protein